MNDEDIKAAVISCIQAAVSMGKKRVTMSPVCRKVKPEIREAIARYANENGIELHVDPTIEEEVLYVHD